jgi:hypothetical protein
MMELKDYLNIIREFSTQYGNLLEDLMEQFGVYSLSQITTEMAREYICEHKRMKRRLDQYEQMVNSWNTCL